MDSSCSPTRRVIAQGPFCTVEECVCGTLRIAIGAMTVHLPRSVVTAIWQTLGEALAPERAHVVGQGHARSTERPS